MFLDLELQVDLILFIPSQEAFHHQASNQHIWTNPGPSVEMADRQMVLGAWRVAADIEEKVLCPTGANLYLLHHIRSCIQALFVTLTTSIFKERNFSILRPLKSRGSMFTIYFRVCRHWWSVVCTSALSPSQTFPCMHPSPYTRVAFALYSHDSTLLSVLMQ